LAESPWGYSYSGLAARDKIDILIVLSPHPHAVTCSISLPL